LAHFCYFTAASFFFVVFVVFFFWLDAFAECNGRAMVPAR
jgi:hypothetical protein